MNRLLTIPTVVCLLWATSLSAAEKKNQAAITWTDPAKAAVEDPDFLMQGEYGVDAKGQDWAVQVVALGAPITEPPAVPLLQDRGQLDGRPAAYVCRDFTCQTPTTRPEVLQTQLARRPQIVSEA